MAVLFYASSRSDTGAFGRVPDWSTHGAAYFVLGTLLCRALAGGLSRPLRAGLGVAAIAIATGYGVTDEFHQAYVPGRESSAGDVLKDFGGSCLAVAVHAARTRRAA
jgi:VanZ family protein